MPSSLATQYSCLIWALLYVVTLALVQYDNKNDKFFFIQRCDFPNGSAKQLYDSIQRLFKLPDSTRMFVGHDYAPGGRELAWETTIGDQKKLNKHLKEGTTLEEFTKMRTERDQQLKAPGLILPALQININGSMLPDPEDNGTAYLKIPLGLFAK